MQKNIKMRVRDVDKEKLVIATAIDQIVEEGFQGFSMNKLAKACVPPNKWHKKYRAVPPGGAVNRPRLSDLTGTI